jgi:hypothetical protein
MRRLFLAAVPLALVAVVSFALTSGCSQSFADKVVSVGQNELTVAKGPEETPETHQVAPGAEVLRDGKPAELEEIQPGDAVKVTTEKQGEEELAVKIEATSSQEEEAAEEASDLEELTAPPIGGMPPPAAESKPAIGAEGEAPRIDEPEAALDEEKESALPEQKEAQSALPEQEPPAEILFTGVMTAVGEDQIRVQGNEEPVGLAHQRSFKLTDATEIFMAGEPAAREDLKEGMEVTVIAELHGAEAVAKRIEAKPMAA